MIATPLSKEAGVRPTSGEVGGLLWPPLWGGSLIKRYKRFLADVHFDDGRLVTVHCPNSGSMRGCSEPGRRVYGRFDNNPRRKLKYTWEIIDMATSLVGVDTLVPNRLVKQSLARGLVPEFTGYDAVQSEVAVGKASRLDVRLAHAARPFCYIEVKNCTLVQDGAACFPDAVTLRGRKHLLTLERLAAEGNRCAMFYLVQRTDAEIFRPAQHIDPAYAETLRRVHQCGVEIVVYDVAIDLKRIRLNRRLPVEGV